jgi:hypothetical protein
MMFRQRTPDLKPATPHYTLAAHLLALGELLDEQQYVEQGLCILASDGGFIVTGFIPATQGLEVTLVQKTSEITSAALAQILKTRNKEDK